MSEDTFVTPGLEPVAELPGSPMGEYAAPAEPVPVKPPVIFTGNWHDLAAMGAFASGLLAVFLCMTLNYGNYCLPFLPLVLGLIGVLTARQAVNGDRARLWSWVGLGIGIALLVLMGLCVALYFGFFVLMMGMPFLFAGAD
jgi:hypothetical protein